jgi:hypothetical protein
MFFSSINVTRRGDKIVLKERLEFWILEISPYFLGRG